MNGSLVYFMRPVGARGPVKIGVSRWPQDRLLKTYAHWSPLPLEVVGTIAGDAKIERRFHAKFAGLHLHHEWFDWSPELEAAIEAVAAGAFDATSLPAEELSLRPSRKGVKLSEEEKARRRAAWPRRRAA